MSQPGPSDAAAPFPPELVQAINRAYESAIDQLGIATSHSDRRAGLAKFIMDFARAGECDESVLRDRAVAAVRRSDRIHLRAHQIWEEEGRPAGRRDEHWHRAERETE